MLIQPRILQGQGSLRGFNLSLGGKIHSVKGDAGFSMFLGLSPKALRVLSEDVLCNLHRQKVAGLVQSATTGRNRDKNSITETETVDVGAKFPRETEERRRVLWAGVVEKGGAPTRP
jgi:hypothetical protein